MLFWRLGDIVVGSAQAKAMYDPINGRASLSHAVTVMC